jgi:hypothetical protein
MTDDEELGAITAPMKGVRLKEPTPIPRLERHPAADGRTSPCELCCKPGQGYRHPNPLRPGVILWRCRRHDFPRAVTDDPKQAPGGGQYR